MGISELKKKFSYFFFDLQLGELYFYKFFFVFFFRSQQINFFQNDG